MAIQTPHGTAPPTDGSVTIPETIDFHRQHNPNAPFFIYAGDVNSSTTTTITHLEFGRASDRAAHVLRPGRNGSRRQVIAIVALSDAILYQAVVVGAMRAGFIPFPISPRNTAAAIIKLLHETSCHRLLTTEGTLKCIIHEVRKSFSSNGPGNQLFVEEMPSLDTIYPYLGHEIDEDPFTPYPAGPRLSLDGTVMYLHSSGSTGLPKSIRHSFLAMIHWASFPVATELRDHPHPQVIAAHAAPCFHTIGVISQILVPLYGLVSIGVYPPTTGTPMSQPMIPTPQNIIDHTRWTRCTSLLILPAFLQLWCNDLQVVEFLASLDFVIFAGGSMPSKIGDCLAKLGVYLTSVYGATEFGTPVHYSRGPGADMDWEYFRFSDQAQLRWVPQGDGTFEAQFLTCNTHQVSVENLGDVPGYASSDLFVRHPTKPKFWKVVGRADDVIIHLSGEKTVPAPMEGIMMGSPYIMAVVMFGRERSQAGALIELKPSYAIDVTDEQQIIQTRNLVWPIVEEANKVCPAFSRIFKELLLFVSRDKPLPRAGKGTVMRKAALSIYKEEINDIYTKVQATVEINVVSPPTSWTYSDIQAWLVAQITNVQTNQSHAKTISLSDDLFEQGLDSLGATILRHRIVSGLLVHSSEAARRIPLSMIYDNPTTEKLTSFLVNLIEQTEDDGSDVRESRIKAIEHMVEKHSSGISSTPIANRNREATNKEAFSGTVVLVTGTTGNLGSQLLETLLLDKSVQRVYTLNRSSGHSDIKKRHIDRFNDKGLTLALLGDPRIIYLEGNISKDRLGLKDQMYDELLQRVNVIIHNAWRLDFNLSLASFEPNIRGTRNIVDLVKSCRHASSLRLLFVSSIASAGSWDKTQGQYPEELVLDAKYAVGNGYGESKYIAERILARSGLNTISLRIGQITGPQPSGAWATTDWVPILVKSSVALGVLPSCTGVVSWLPMDAVAQIFLDVALNFQSTKSSPSHCALNLLHPSPVAWDAVLAGIADALLKGGVVEERLPLVEFHQWFKLLEDRSTLAGVDSTIEDLPAIKLLAFFRRLAEADVWLRGRGETTCEAGAVAEFSTQKARNISTQMSTLPSLGPEDTYAWVAYWKRAGLFNSHKRFLANHS